MKAYILSLVTLLTALALPANGQTGSTNTKAAPLPPTMPYKLNLVTIGANNGTVAVEDNKAGGNGITTAGNDTLVYGESGNNATTVKLTVTPNDGYVVRKNYPKAYKTGNTGTTVAISGSSSPYTFSMPAHPVTVEIAYACQIKSIAAVTLKEAATDANAAIALLPKYIHITLANGDKDSLQVASTSGWIFKASGSTGDGTTTYDTKAGAVNRFTATLTANDLPNSIDKGELLTESGNIYTAEVLVANRAEPLKPDDSDKDKGITISGGTGDNLNGKTEDETGNGTTFDGTIGSDTKTTVKSLEVSGDVKDATLTLSNISVAGGSNAEDNKTEIKDGASLTLKLKGDNTLGTLKVEGNASVILHPEAGAKLTDTKIENAGTFIDSTATVSKVEGTGGLDIKGSLDGGGSVTAGSTLTLTAVTNDKVGTTSFIWQQIQADGSYKTLKTNKYDKDGTLMKSTAGISDKYEPATSATGSTQYRCLIKREVTPSGGATVLTLLSTKSETVTVTPKDTPDPGPAPDPSPEVYHSVILPQLTGATTDPGAGTYEVNSWGEFSFTLTLDKEYDLSEPVVTTNKGETITPRDSDGKYLIRFIRSDLSISITGIVKNNPTANDNINAPTTRVWGSRGYLHISQPVPGMVTVYTIGGALLKSALLPGSESQMEIPAGCYVVVTTDSSFKVIIQ